MRTKDKIYNPIFILFQIDGNDFQDKIRERLFELTSTGELNAIPVAPPGMKRALQRFVDSVPGLANSYLRGLARQVNILRKQALSLASSSPNKQNPTTIINVITGSLTRRSIPVLAILGIADSTNNHAAWVGDRGRFFAGKV
ncbi:MAG: hypothetical protein MUO68_15125 [Desulfobacteraceae bacterium]|nr:hypothetical protein [Desulfobacteraceae bacterium]